MSGRHELHGGGLLTLRDPGGSLERDDVDQDGQSRPGRVHRHEPVEHLVRRGERLRRGRAITSNAASTWLTLTESWDGSTWRIVPSPNPTGVAGSELIGVSCPGPNSCVAVGESFDNTGNSFTLAEIWDGSTWSLVTTPNAASGSEDVLNAVSCVSSSQCTAVGQYAALNEAMPPLVELWNDTEWSLVAGVRGNGQLAGIDCTGGSTCMAVGSYADDEIDGTWSKAGIAKPTGTYGPVLASVSCTSASHCIAVGFSTGKASDTTYNLSEIWTGSSWALLSTPNAATT